MRRVSGVLDAVVAKPRERQALAADVASMRERIERDKAPAKGFDVKLARGGLIDCEFAAQFLVLGGLGRLAGEPTPETLRRALAGRCLPFEAGERLRISARLQGAILHMERVAGDKAFDPDTAPEALKRLMVSAVNSVLADEQSPDAPVTVVSFEALTEMLAAMQARTRLALEELLGTTIGG
jgi:glutamate-ammonia-ligase adenylyltransferase